MGLLDAPSSKLGRENFSQVVNEKLKVIVQKIMVEELPNAMTMQEHDHSGATFSDFCVALLCR